MDWPTYLVQLLARLLATFPDEWPAQLVEPLPGLPGELSGEMAEGDDILLSAAAGFRSQTSDVSSLLARFGAHSAEAPDDETRTAFADGITGTALLWRGNLEGEASSRDSSDILLELLGGRRADNPEDELWCIYEWTLGFNRSMSLLGAGNPLAQQLADAASGLTDDVVSRLKRPPDVRAHTAETSEEPDDGDGRESEELRVRRAWLQWLDATDGDVSAASERDDLRHRSGVGCDRGAVGACRAVRRRRFQASRRVTTGGRITH